MYSLLIEICSRSQTPGCIDRGSSERKFVIHNYIDNNIDESTPEHRVYLVRVFLYLDLTRECRD